MFSALATSLTILLSCQHVLSSPVDELFEKRSTSSTMQCNSDNVLRALQHRTPDSYSFCSSYISQPYATTTTYKDVSTYTHHSLVTVTVRPLSFCNVQRYDDYSYYPQYSETSPAPITYKSPVTASTVPGCPCNYPRTEGCAIQAKRELMPRANSSPTTAGRTTTAAVPTMTSTTTTMGTVPDYLATVPPSRISSGCSCLSVPYATVTTYTSIEVDIEGTPCTYYTTTATAEYPAYCQSGVYLNSPAIATGVANLTTVKSFKSPSKLDCCNSCSKVLNCVWWKFDFGHPHANGTGDAFLPGTCQYAFFTGYNPSSIDGNTPALCPNGEVDPIPSQYAGLGYGGSGYDHPGYNRGPCGYGLNAFESSQEWYPEYQEGQC